MAKKAVPILLFDKKYKIEVLFTVGLHPPYVAEKLCTVVALFSAFLFTENPEFVISILKNTEGKYGTWKRIKMSGL